MVKCDDCNKERRTRNVLLVKGRFVCKNCRMKLEGHKIMTKNIPFTPDIEKALKRTYKMKTYFNEHKSAYCVCNFPRTLSGINFKINVVEEKNGKQKKHRQRKNEEE